MSKKKIPVAIQLYSLRDVIGKDVPGTLKKVAAMGYAGVEFAGYYGLSGKELRALLDKNGLKCAGSHVGLPLLEGDVLKETVATNKVLGTDRLIIPNAPLDTLDETIRRMNAAYKAATAMGMRVGYHNHTKEFETVDGVTKFDRIFSETPDDFLVQVDIGWATAAGQDVAALLRKYAKRIETVHVKEFKKGDPAAVVGEGAVKWPATMDLLEAETSVKWYIVEQEQFRIGPMESAKDCIDNIRKIGR
jgi:sugar phosphate isomerase/epimerase